MIFPTPENWAEWEVTEELHKFFLLLWVELFAERTLDTWQVRSANVRTLIQELRDAVTIAEHHPPHAGNIPHLIEEADYAATRDPIIGSHFSFFRAYLTPLREINRDSANLPELRRRTTVMLGHLDEYRTCVENELRQLLKEGPGKEKEKMRRLTMALATELAAQGYSTPHLCEVASFLKTPGKPFLDRFELLLSACPGKRQEATCSLAISWPYKLLDKTTNGGISCEKGRPARTLTPAEEEFFSKIAPNDVVATVSIEALDPHDARRIAEARLADAFAAIHLYQPQRRFDVKGREALVTFAGRPPRLVLPDPSRNNYIRNARSADEDTERLWRLIASLPQRERDALTASLQYHYLALTAHRDEARLVNLWIALESIAAVGRGSIIDRVCEYVAPCVAVLNVRKLLTGIAVYIVSLAKQHKDPDDFSIAFPDTTGIYISPVRLLEALTDVKEGPRINALYRIVANHPLIKNRIHHLRNEILMDPEKLALGIEQHRQNVDWQLRRIYRARNQVAHRAGSPTALRHVLQHLHTYLNVTVHGVVFDLLNHVEWGILDALEHRRQLFGYYVNLLKSERKHEFTHEALVNPAQSMALKSGTPVWPRPPVVSSTPVAPSTPSAPIGPPASAKPSAKTE